MILYRFSFEKGKIARKKIEAEEVKGKYKVDIGLIAKQGVGSIYFKNENTYFMYLPSNDPTYFKSKLMENLKFYEKRHPGRFAEDIKLLEGLEK